MSSTIVITGARLIDGAGRILNDPLIVIADGRFRAVGSRGSIEVSQGATAIDARDCTLMPGLIDAHVHLGAFNCTSFGNARVSRFEVTPQLQSFYALFHAQLCFEMGFTTLRDAGRGTPRGDFAEEMCAVRDAINAGIVAGPRLLVLAETVITGGHRSRCLAPCAGRRISRPMDPGHCGARYGSSFAAGLMASRPVCLAALHSAPARTCAT